MAIYTINFSTNAPQAIKDLRRLEDEITRIVKVGNKVELSLDTSNLNGAINATFRRLDREIENAQKKLRRLQIGGPGFRLIAEQLGRKEGLQERGRLIAESRRLRGQAEAFDGGSIIALEKSIKALQIEASQIKPNTKEWIDLQRRISAFDTQLVKTRNLAESIRLTESLGAFAPGSLNQLEAKLTILRNKARDISPDTTQWKQLNKEIQRTEGLIEKQTAPPMGAGTRLGAAGGAFLYGGGVGGGIGSALGGVIGGLAGGVPGAFTGAAIGQLTDSITQSIGAMATQASSLQRMQRGLAQASIDAKDFALAQEAVFASSQKLLMPLEQTMKYYTQLRVNTKQYGLSVQDTQKIFEGTALAIMATGGSMEDLDGAMRAVVQVMSKGKLSAEELRGQLGERLPGAVVKFAAANNLSLQDLDKLLEQGKLGVGEFVKFLKGSEEEYKNFSKTLQTAPEYAGMRLQKSFENIRLALGDVFAPAGASLQDMLARMLNGVASFVKENRPLIRQLIEDWKTIVVPIAKVFGDIVKLGWEMTKKIVGFFQEIFRQVRKSFGMLGAVEIKAELDLLDKKIKDVGGEKALRSRERGGQMHPLLAQRSQLQKQFLEKGGQAAVDQAMKPLAASDDFSYGGPGAGMSLKGKEDEESKKKSKEEQLKKQRQQAALDIANYQNKLNEISFEALKNLSEENLENQKRLIDARFDYEVAGMNDMQARQKKFEKQLYDIQFKRISDIAKIEQEAAKARLETKAASQMAIAAGSLSGSSQQSISIVEFGKQLQRMGFTVKEHPAFGGVGRHSRGSYHYSGEALDITDWRPGAWQSRTKQLGETLRRSGAATQVFHPGFDPVGGHGTHVHAAFKGGRVPLTAGMRQFLGMGATTAAPAAGTGFATRRTAARENYDLQIAKEKELQQAKLASLQIENRIKQSLLETDAAIKANIATIYPVEQQKIENELLRIRNELQLKGMPQEYIEFEEKRSRAKIEGVYAERAFQESIARTENSLNDYIKTIGGEANATEESKRQIKAYRDEIEKYKKAIEDLPVKQLEFTRELIKNTIENLKNADALKKQQEALQLVDSTVSGTVGSYKNLMQALIKGPSKDLLKNIAETEAQIVEERGQVTPNTKKISELEADLKQMRQEAVTGPIKQFQEAIADQFIGMFLDYTMKPIESFMKEAFANMFGIKTEEQARKEALNKAQAQLDAINEQIAITKAIKQDTGAIASGGPGGGQQQGQAFASAFAPQGTMGSLQAFGMGGTASSVFGSADMTQAMQSAQSFIDNGGFTQVSDQFNSLASSTKAFTGNFNLNIDSLKNANESFKQVNVETQKNGLSFTQALGKTVQGIGIAATTVMGIMSGINQIKEGGTSNTLAGIGSIFMSLGSAVGGFVGMGLLPGKKAANGGIATGGWKPFPIKPFATGGVVNGPTLGLVGEGKYNEAIVPLPDGRSIPVIMKGEQPSSRELLSGKNSSSMASSPVLNMSFQTTTINGVEYVSRDQLEAAMMETRKLAARDGANRGAALAIDRLQHSPNTRRRIGMS